MANNEMNVGCECCEGDEALFWKDEDDSAFVDSTGEMQVTAGGQIIRFKVEHCPKCGRRFTT